MPQTSVGAIGSADRLALDDAIAGEILPGHEAGVRRRVPYGCDQGVPEPASIEGCAALAGDRAQGLREVWVAQCRARWARSALWRQEVCARGWELSERVFVLGDGTRQSWRDLEAPFRKLRGRSHQLGPGQPSEALVRTLEQRQGSWHPDGATARDRVLERHRGAVRLEEQVRAGGRRGGLASVQGRQARAFWRPSRAEMRRHRCPRTAARPD